MSFSFNLIDQPWIPCIMPDGRTVELGLLELLERAAELRELHESSPLAVVCLNRLLLAILHRNYGPASLSEWEELWSHGRWESETLRRYFGRWADRFDLFHPHRPFYQTPGLQLKMLSVAKLAPELADAGTPTLFDHTTDEQPPAILPGQAARLVVACQGFALGGLVSRLPGEPPSALAAPLVTGAVIQFQGSNVFETLMLNLLIYNDSEPWENQRQDLPCWEQPDPDYGTRAPLGYLDYLTWQSRRTLLFPEMLDGAPVVRQAMQGAGARFPGGLEIRDPQFAYRKNERKNPRPGDPAWLPLRLRPERALWRDSTALLASSTEQHRPPLIRNWLAHLIATGRLSRSARYRLSVSGLVSDRAKVFAWRHERMPVPAHYFEDRDLVEALKKALDLSEKANSTVRGALLSATQPRHRKERGETELTAGVGQRRYWSLLELPFWQLVEDLPLDQQGSLARWVVSLRSAAMEAFDHAVSGLEEGRLLREITLARALLERRLRAQLKPLEEVVDEGGQEGAVRGTPRTAEGSR